MAAIRIASFYVNATKSQNKEIVVLKATPYKLVIFIYFDQAKRLIKNRTNALCLLKYGTHCKNLYKGCNICCVDPNTVRTNYFLRLQMRMEYLKTSSPRNGDRKWHYLLCSFANGFHLFISKTDLYRIEEHLATAHTLTYFVGRILIKPSKTNGAHFMDQTPP